MSLPSPIQTLWDQLQAVRGEVLREVEAVSQRQADWKPADTEWSIGEVIDHLTVAEAATGKVTTKLTREAEAAGTLRPWPAGLSALAPLPAWPPGPAEAPSVVWPSHGKPLGELIAAMKATRERSRQSMERLASVDPRGLLFPHGRLGPLDLGQWWTLQAEHDRIHLAQLRAIKRAPGFPSA